MYIFYHFQTILVNGVWSAWGSFSDCSATCGGGYKSRSRLCNSPIPDPDGIPCNASESTETIECNTDACPGKILRKYNYIWEGGGR
jgi:hypothetical protein